MSLRPTSSSIERQLGLSMVEIMVALVISLMLLGALSHFLISGRAMGRTDDDLARMQENGRYAMEIIGRAIRNAGYRLDIGQPFDANGSPAPRAAIEGTEGGGSSGTAAPPDTITLRHDPAWIRDASNELQGAEANCAGGVIRSDNGVDAVTGARPANSHLIVYAFSIDNGQLKCSTLHDNGSATSAIVANGIENLQIEYGLDTAGNGNITSYVKADAIPNASQVAAVRVSLLVRSANRGTAAGNTQTVNYNGAAETKNDGFLRQVYTTTFTARNHAK